MSHHLARVDMSSAPLGITLRLQQRTFCQLNPSDGENSDIGTENHVVMFLFGERKDVPSPVSPVWRDRIGVKQS